MSKFFTYEDRLSLLKYLEDSLAFKAIAHHMDKNPTTISRKVRNYSSLIATDYPGLPFNVCKNRYDCRKKKVCGKVCTRKSEFDSKTDVIICYCGKICNEYLSCFTRVQTDICRRRAGISECI